MSIQYINLGANPSGAGGDTVRSANVKTNENFSNQQHAASRLIGEAAGNVMQVGAFGLGAAKDNASMIVTETGFSNSGVNLVLGMYKSGTEAAMLILPSNDNYNPLWRAVSKDDVSKYSPYYEFHSTRNTTIDSNGFIKKASPVIQLFADKITANDEASEQNPVFEKVDVGHYLIKNTQGFAKDGWWIQVTDDTNGNKICAVEYQTLENGDLEIKTFKKKLNDDGDIVANLDMPIDIPQNKNGEPRWIDIRLNELPKKPTVQRTPRTQKQPKMLQQIKYTLQKTYGRKLETLFDDSGNIVIVDGKEYQKPVTYELTHENGEPILTSQPEIDASGANVFEWVVAVDEHNKPIFEDVPVLDEHGEQIYDEVTHDTVE